MERRKRWSFGFRANNSWFWHAVDPDGNEAFSDTQFKTLADCRLNAIRHGYVAWDLTGERRQEPKDALES